MRVIFSVFLTSFAFASGSVSATVFDFANLKYSGGTNTGFLPTDGVSCSSGDLCSSDVNSGVFNGDLTFTQDGLTVLATGQYQGNVAAVVQDHVNGYNGQLSGPNAIGAGLGVYHVVPVDNSDDNVTAGESLHLHFDQNIMLQSLGLRSEGHTTIGWGTNRTFEYSFDGSTWTEALLPTNVGQFGLSHTGQDLYVRFGDANPDQFYISSITVSPVPEPETYAMLLVGLGLVAFAVHRRRNDLNFSRN